ncbi:sulfotransferase 6B1-like [Clarias magur]|uniref:Sulfotransferase n=1 Tax=Clarias magur TaxID=1594786 RepID=A0A8J4X627_CLAMG|nr:sulfotransferase 6B1-like [Clarias magur]
MSAPTSAAKRESVMERGMKMKDEEKLYKRDGILYPTIMSPPENLDALKDLEAREDDLAGQMPPRRFFATHLHPDFIPASFKTNKTKMLVVFRNPKDTLVSYYHFMNSNPVLPKVESWDKFCSDFLSGEVAWGSYFDHALAWEKHMDDPNVLIMAYEELKENLPEGVKKVADFFSFPLTDEQVDAIAGESTFSAMRTSSENSHGKFGNVFFRKGEVGDWKNHFSEAQSKQMDEEFKKKLSGTRLGAKLKYEQYCQ